MKKAPSPPKRNRLFLIGAILVSISVAFSLFLIMISLGDPELGSLVLELVVMVSPVIILGIILILIGNHRSKSIPNEESMVGVSTIRNNVGALNIYLRVVGRSSLLLLFLWPPFLAIWAVLGHWGWGSVVWLGILSLVGLFFAYWIFGPAARDVWRDVFSRRTSLSGRVVRKAITEHSGGSAGQYTYYPSKDYHIIISGRKFDVSKKIHDWLSLDDEVVVHYWPRTETVSKVERLSTR